VLDPIVCPTSIIICFRETGEALCDQDSLPSSALRKLGLVFYIPRRFDELGGVEFPNYPRLVVWLCRSELYLSRVYAPHPPFAIAADHNYIFKSLRRSYDMKISLRFMSTISFHIAMFMCSTKPSLGPYQL
jgi:hypothetical protein